MPTALWPSPSSARSLEDSFALERAGNFAGYAHDYTDTVGKDHGRIERRHWRVPSGCENAHHWVLDVAFGDDDSRIRTGYAAHNMTIPSASPTTCSGRTGRSRRASPTSGWLGQELPVPTDWPQAQTHLDAIARDGPRCSPSVLQQGLEYGCPTYTTSRQARTSPTAQRRWGPQAIPRK